MNTMNTARKFCPHCGEPVLPPGVFCAKCGQNLRQSIRPPTNEQQEAIPPIIPQPTVLIETPYRTPERVSTVHSRRVPILLIGVIAFVLIGGFFVTPPVSKFAVERMIIGEWQGVSGTGLARNAQLNPSLVFQADGTGGVQGIDGGGNVFRYKVLDYNTIELQFADGSQGSIKITPSWNSFSITANGTTIQYERTK